MKRKVKQVVDLARSCDLREEDWDQLLDALAALRAKQARESLKPQKKYGDGCLDIKIVGGHQYAYRRYLQGGKLRSQYLGPVGSPKTQEKIKALGLSAIA